MSEDMDDNNSNEEAVSGGETASPQNNGDRATPSYYVGVGASAGGLEAIEAFFSKVPSDSGMGFIVVQHLSPDYKSMMVKLLSKKTSLHVTHAQDDQLVEPNTVYLIPPKHNLKIRNGRLYLCDQDHSKGINLPIDVFLRSLAEDQKAKSIAVILSGSGSDGMHGIAYIKEAGGLVAVQDPAAAKFDGMPQSAISTGMTDLVQSAENIPESLLAYARHPLAVMDPADDLATKNNDELSRVLAIVRYRTGVDFSEYKLNTVTRRVQRRISVNQLNDIHQYLELIERVPNEANILYRELLIGVTNFFRDPEAWEIIASKVLPAIFSDNNAEELRFWVAGCSTGEEAYTLAILCLEYLEQNNLHRSFKIFATDVDANAIQIAGAGRYPESIANDLTQKRLEKYFTHRGSYFQINRHVRECVVVAQQNVTKDPPFAKTDLILCRNLLIYLQNSLQLKVLNNFSFSLRRGGFLFLGASENVGQFGGNFDTIHAKWRVYQSRARRDAPTERRDYLVPRVSGEAKAPVDLPQPQLRGRRSREEEAMIDRFLESLIGTYVPAYVVVDQNMAIVFSSGDISRYLHLPAGRMLNDIGKMVSRDLSVPLATGLQKAFRKEEELRYSNIRMRIHSKAVVVELHIVPLPRRREQEPLVSVFFRESSDEREPADKNKAYYDASDETAQRINDLEQELMFTRESLQATIEELETSNEELQATNEELVASNEELQSTNEELQSVNEELYTVNAEYQSKIAELEELNEDIDNLLESSEIGTLFLDENLVIRKFTPLIKNLLSVLEADIGRTITHFTDRLRSVNLFEIIESVRREKESKELEVQLSDGSWYLLRVHPYRSDNMNKKGIVVSFVDIGKLVAAREKLALSQEFLRRSGQMARIGGWVFDLEENRADWSDEVYQVFEVPRGKQLTLEECIELYHEDDREAVKAVINESISKGEDFTFEYRVKTPHGKIKWITAWGTPKSVNGKVIRLSGVVQDATKRRVAELDSADRFQDLETIFNTIKSCIWYKDQKLRILNLNQAAADFMGTEIEEALGQSASDLTPNWPQSLQEREKQALDNSETFVNELVYLEGPEGERLLTRVDIMPHKENDDVAGVVLVLRDMTGLGDQIDQQKLSRRETASR